ncbi:MAG: enoyl-CoA hydratase/isomerase family protein [Candidatus Rokuibacteriota bacterium]
MSQTTVVLETAGDVARVTLNRPDILNAGHRAWVREMVDIVNRLAEAPPRVVVVTGAGRAFCTGVDLKALAAGDFGLDDFIAWESMMVALEGLDCLTIAAINGHCVGGGLQLALVCDYRLASEGALIGLPAVKECLIPSMALYRLPRLIGVSRAKELILLGDLVTAREAERYGLLNRVVSALDFPQVLEETIERFRSLPGASARASKSLVARAFDLDFEAFREAMQERLRACLADQEHRQAMDAIRGRLT